MLIIFLILISIFIGLLLLVLKKRSFIKLINKGNLYSALLKQNRKNDIKFLSNNNSYLNNNEEKSTQYFIKILKEIKFFVFLKVIEKIN